MRLFLLPFLFSLCLTSCRIPWSEDSSAEKKEQATEEAALDSMIACTRDSETRITNVRFNNIDKCIGSAIIQGISYKCGNKDEVWPKTRQFLDELNAKAKERCEELCDERGPACRASYHPIEKCGFMVAPKDSIIVGTKIVGCGPTCEGRAFAYCSLYHGSYFRIEEDMFKNKKPNCFCENRKKSAR